MPGRGLLGFQQAFGLGPMEQTLGRRSTALVAALAALLAGCMERISTLTVPVSSWPGYTYMTLAQKQGFDREAGLDLRLIRYADTQAIKQAYLAGELSIAQLTAPEVIEICQRQPARCPQVVLVVNESRGGDQIVAQPSISGVRGLRGRRVAVSPSSLGPFVLSRALAQEGMTLADVTLVPMAIEDMQASLRLGDVDAATLYPPYSSSIKDLGLGRVIFDSARIPGTIFDLLVVDPALVQRDPRAITKLLTAWQSAHAYADREPAATHQLLGRLFGPNPEEFDRQEAGLVYFPLSEQAPMLTEGGPIARNLRQVREVMVTLNQATAAGELPRINGGFVARALQSSAVSDPAPK